MPTTTGWFAQEEMNAMDIYHNRPASDARRFESGTPCVSAAYACAAGIDLLLETPLEAVQAQIEYLTGLIAGQALARGWRLVTPAEPACHGALMAIASTDAPALVQALGADGVVVSDRDGNLRVAPHYYNDEGDIDALFGALDRHAKWLQPAD